MGGALWYGWGTYGLNGWGSYDKVSCCFVWKYAQKIAGLQGNSLHEAHWLSNRELWTAIQWEGISVVVCYAQVTGRLGYAREMVCMKLAYG